MSVSVASVSAKHKVFGVKFDPALYNVVPGCKILGDKVVVPHTIETTRLARNLGYRVPSPILVRYDWAGGVPFDAQRITAALMVQNTRAFILSEIGTGKTRAALYAIDFLLREGIIKHALIAAPLSTLSQVWDKEIFQYFPHLTTQILHGSREQRRKALATPADIYIINHDGIETIQADLCSKNFGGRRCRRTFLLQEWHNGQVEVHEQDDYGMPLYLGTYWVAHPGGARRCLLPDQATQAGSSAEVLQSLQGSYHDQGLELSLGGQADLFGDSLRSHAAWRALFAKGHRGASRDLL